MAGLKRKADGVRGAEHDQQADVTDVTPGSGSRASGRTRASRGTRGRGASSVVSSPENNASSRPGGHEENGQPSGDTAAEAKSEPSAKKRKVAEPSDPSTPTRQSARIKARTNSSSSVESSPTTRLRNSTEPTANGESAIARDSTPDSASSRSSQAGDEGSPVQLVEQPVEPESNASTPSNKRRLQSPEEETQEINGKVKNEDDDDDQEGGGEEEEEEKQTTSPPTPEAADDVQAEKNDRAAPAARGRGRGRGGRGRGFRGRGRGAARGGSTVRGRGRGRGGFRGGGRPGRRGADEESDFELDRSPSPTPAILKLQDRQKELKQAFKRLAGAQRLALNVLGTLTQQRLIRDKNAHRRVPEYEEVQQDLQERLHQRQEILRHRYELQVEQENRLFEAGKEVLENRLRTSIKHVHEEHLHAAQGAYIAFVEGIRTAEDDEHTEPDIDQPEPADVTPKTEREGSVESNYEPLYMDEPRIVRGYVSSFIRTPSGAAQCELGEKRWEDFVKRARIQEISQEAAPPPASASGPDPLVSLLEASESIAVSEEPPVALQALADTAVNSIASGSKAEESTASTTATTAATTAAATPPTTTSPSTTTAIATTASSSAPPLATTSASTSQLPPLLPHPPPTSSAATPTAAPATMASSSTQQPAAPPPPAPPAPPTSASSTSQLPPLQPQRPTIPRPTLPSLHGLPDPFGSPGGGPPTLPPPPGMTFPPRRDGFAPPHSLPPPPPPPTQPHPHPHPHHPNYSRSYDVPPPQHPPHPAPHPQHPGPYGWLPPLRGYDMRNPPPSNPPPPRRPY